MPDSDSARRRAQGGDAAARQDYNARRAADPLMAFATQVYHSQRWRILRAIHLNREPLCRACYANGERVVPAVLVDHVVSIRVDPSRAYDDTNLQALCQGCHNAKTAREDRAALGVNSPPASVPGPPSPVPPCVPRHVLDAYRARRSRYPRRDA